MNSCPCAVKTRKGYRQCKGVAAVLRYDIGLYVCGSHGRRQRKPVLCENIPSDEWEDYPDDDGREILGYLNGQAIYP